MVTIKKIYESIIALLLSFLLGANFKYIAIAIVILIIFSMIDIITTTIMFFKFKKKYAKIDIIEKKIISTFSIISIIILAYLIDEMIFHFISYLNLGLWVAGFFCFKILNNIIENLEAISGENYDIIFFKKLLNIVSKKFIKKLLNDSNDLQNINKNKNKNDDDKTTT